MATSKEGMNGMENQLEEAREIINRVDREMARLFVQRMEASRQVAAYKREHGLPVFDAAREAAVIQRNLSYIEDDALHSFYTLFQRDVMNVSKLYQQKLMQGIRAAYSGVEGAFA